MEWRGALAAVVLVSVSLSGCAGSPSAAVPVSVTIGELPERTSLTVHGEARLERPSAAAEEDFRQLATDTGQDPEDVVRDFAAQSAFDRVVQIAQNAHVGYADAVFRPGVEAASELRFVHRPPETLIDQLAREYPRELLVTWGEHLTGDSDRDALSETVYKIIRDLPATGNVITGVDGDGRLTAEYDGSASGQFRKSVGGCCWSVR